MPDIQRILDVLAALVGAIPGRHGGATISLHGCGDSTLSLIERAGGRRDHYTSLDGTEEWVRASIAIGEVCVEVYSLHRPAIEIEREIERASAALADAEALLREVKS